MSVYNIKTSKKLRNKISSSIKYSDIWHKKKFYYTTNETTFLIWIKKEKRLTGRNILEEKRINNEISKNNKNKLLKMFSIYQDKNIIGADEVGTSEYLYPIVVAACYIPKEKLVLIKNLDLKDSKFLTREEIYLKAKQIMKIAHYNFNILLNEDFNKFQNNNLNYIKSTLFNKVIEPLLKNNYDFIIIDGFTSVDNFYEYLKKQKVESNILLMPKADNYVLSVICASIIAKYIQYEEIKKIEKQLKTKLPTNPKANTNFCIKQIKKQNITFLDKYTKKKLTYTKKILQKLYDKE